MNTMCCPSGDTSAAPASRAGSVILFLCDPFEFIVQRAEIRFPRELENTICLPSIVYSGKMSSKRLFVITRRSEPSGLIVAKR